MLGCMFAHDEPCLENFMKLDFVCISFTVGHKRRPEETISKLVLLLLLLLLALWLIGFVFYFCKK
jgi:hypothetical protein